MVGGVGGKSRGRGNHSEIPERLKCTAKIAALVKRLEREGIDFGAIPRDWFRPSLGGILGDGEFLEAFAVSMIGPSHNSKYHEI